MLSDSFMELAEKLGRLNGEIICSHLSPAEYLDLSDSLSFLYGQVRCILDEFEERFPCTTLARILPVAEKNFGFENTKQAIGIMYPDAEDYDAVYMTRKDLREFTQVVIKESENV